MLFFTVLATQARGSKQYELTDHLGNIRTVIPDIKDPLSLPQNQNFRLPTLTLNNYYPYGMLLAGLQVGVYMLQIKAGNTLAQQKVVVWR